MVEFVVVGQQETKGPTRGSVVFRTFVIQGGFSTREEAEATARREDLGSLSDRGGINIEELTPSLQQKLGLITKEIPAEEKRRPDIEEALAKRDALNIANKAIRESRTSAERSRARAERDRISAVPVSQATSERLAQAREEPEVLTRAELTRERQVASRQRQQRLLGRLEEQRIKEEDRGIRATVSTGPQLIESTLDLRPSGAVTGFRAEPVKAVPRKVSAVEEQFVAFETRVQAQRERELRFGTSVGFQRIETTAGLLTGGVRIRGGRLQVLPIEERGAVGGVAQALVRDIAGFPIAVGGAIAGGVEKLRLTGEAIALGRREVPGGFVQIKRRDILGEFTVGAPTRIVTEFQALPKREKIATGLFIATAPLIGGGAIRRLVQRRTVKAKAIEELTPKKLAEFERFELSVQDLKGIRTRAKIIDLKEVERLPPKAASALDRVILRRKREIVIGGSVAQRTQIEGKSRIPADVDIFTRGDTKQLVQEIATELKQAGVERVSTVRGKQVTIAGKKAVEVKELSLLEQNIKKVQLPFIPVGSAFATTPRGVRVLRLGSQAQRKLIGGFGLEQERIRAKDVADLPSILKQLRKSRRASFIPRRLRRREPFALPSQFPKPLRREPSSLLGRRRGEPSGLGGPIISRPSILKPIEPSPVSALTKIEQPPSILKPTKGRPSVLRPSDISGLVSTVTKPSQLTPLQDITQLTRRPPFTFKLPEPKKDEEKRRNIPVTLRRKFRGTKSLSVVLGGVGVQLTKAQIAGTASISPLLVRDIRKGRR